MLDTDLRCRACRCRVGDMNNAAAKSTVATLIACAPCYYLATTWTPKPTDEQRDAAEAMMAKVGYYSHGEERFHDTRADEEATCGICFHDVDSYIVLWGSPDN